MNKPVNPDMFILARESRGYTQSELAKLLEITQATISKIEKGLKNASSDLIANASGVLEFPESFFYQNDRRYPPATPFHRKKQSLPKKLQYQIEATSNIKRIHITKLLEGVEVVDSKIIYMDLDDYGGSPSEIACAFRRYLKLPRGPIDNLTNLLEDIGIIIIPCDFKTRLLDGFTLVTERNQPVIFINRDAPGDRLRFTLAHELGHIVMHNVQHPDMEKEADSFASELLIPSDEIRPSFSKGVDLSKLAALKPYWKVSMASLLVKASSLGKITPNQGRYLWSQMSKYGYRKQEPPRLNIPREEPGLFKEIVNLYLVELGFTVDDLCNTMSTYLDDFMSLYPGLIASKNLLRVVK